MHANDPPSAANVIGCVGSTLLDFRWYLVGSFGLVWPSFGFGVLPGFCRDGTRVPHYPRKITM